VAQWSEALIGPTSEGSTQAPAEVTVLTGTPPVSDGYPLTARV